MASIDGLGKEWVLPFEKHAFRVTPTLATELTGTVDIALETIPQGTVITGCTVSVVSAEAGATSSALDVEVAGLDLLDCGADSLGATGRQSMDDGSSTTLVSAINTALLSASYPLNCEITYVGTATTAPTFVIEITGGRFDY